MIAIRVRMFSIFVETGILLFMTVQAAVALIAVVLAMKWKKTEFVAGLFFLFIYTVLDLVGVVYSMVIPGEYVDVAQFGFILLAIIFFLIGMNPSWAAALGRQDEKERETGKATKDEALFAHLKKL